jgi:hypothetical protein
MQRLTFSLAQTSYATRSNGKLFLKDSISTWAPPKPGTGRNFVLGRAHWPRKRMSMLQRNFLAIPDTPTAFWACMHFRICWRSNLRERGIELHIIKVRHLWTND